MRVARGRATMLGLCCVLGGGGCSHRAERSLEVSDLLPGSWVQVWPARGVLDTLILRSNGDVGGSVLGLQLPFTHREHMTWHTDFAMQPGALCVAEGPWTGGQRGIACNGFRLAGDTLLLAGDAARYMRIRPGRPPIAAWSGPGEYVLPPAPGESVRALAPPRGITVRAFRDSASPKKAGRR